MRTVAVLRGVALLALGAGLLSACGDSPTASIPSPHVSKFLPANYRVTSVLRVDLDGSGLPEEAIAAVGPVSVKPGLATSTVLLLAWDSVTQRWTAPYDALHQASWQQHSQLGSGPGLVSLSGRGPHLAVIHDQSNGRSDLLYWLDSVSGNTATTVVGIVHYQSHRANLVYSHRDNDGHVSRFDLHPASAAGVVRVIDTAPDQQVRITQPWLSGADSESVAVRRYSYVIAPISTDHATTLDQYRIVSDNMPYIGVGLLELSSVQSVVEYVNPTSPAFGRLHVGDVVIGIANSPLSTPAASHLVGPTVIDAVELLYPGDEVWVNVERNGAPLVIRVKLAQWPLGSISPFEYIQQQYLSIM
ncbi:MAG: hypothetical protein ACRDVC_10365 [Acidimicrobiales bacterium]